MLRGIGLVREVITGRTLDYIARFLILLDSLNNKDIHILLDPLNNMWQSRVEIEHYSIAYFDRITALEMRYL